MNDGKLIVLTAPLTETIDHAGYFIQMSMASLPMWLEGILNRKYPKWREVEANSDGTARYMPAGVRVLEAALLGTSFRGSQEPATDTQARVAHEDAADACSQAVVAGGMPAHGPNQLVLDPAAHNLLLHQHVGVGGGIDEPDEGGDLVVAQHIQRVGLEGGGMQVTQGGEVVHADRLQGQLGIKKTGGACPGNRRHTHYSFASRGEFCRYVDHP